MYGVQALPSNFGTGTITTMYALYGKCANWTSPGVVTNCYELYLDTPNTTSPITNKYGVYQTDTASKNYFAGNVGIGTTAPQGILHVSGGTASNGVPETIAMTGTGGANSNNYNWGITAANDTNWGFRVVNPSSGYYYTDVTGGWSSNSGGAFRVINKVGAAETEYMRVNAGGKVGIGSTAPVVSLDLSKETDAVALPVGTTGQRPTGANLANGEIRYNSTTPAVEAYINGAWASFVTSGSGGGLTGSQYQMAYFSATNIAGGDANITTDAGNDFIITIGNLAIGTTTVTNAINLSGASAQTIGMMSGATVGKNLTLQSGRGLSSGTDENGGDLVLASGITTGTGTSNIQFSLYPAGSTGTADNAALTALTVSATGLIGTTAETTLQANAGSGSNQNGGGFTLASGVSTGTGTSSISFSVYGAGGSGSTANTATTAMTIDSTGNVGIGTTSPATGMKVDINGPVKVAGTGSETCSASTIGAMRYNAAGNYMEICSFP